MGSELGRTYVERKNEAELAITMTTPNPSRALSHGWKGDD